MSCSQLVKNGGMIAGALLAYAIFVEPYSIEHVEITLTCDHLPKEFDGYRVLFLSDFHSRNIGLREKRLLKVIGSLPTHDLIALGGDLTYTPRGMEPMCDLLGKLNASNGIFGVFGNSEHKNGVPPRQFAELLEKSGVHMLLNRHQYIEKNGSSIAVVGVDDPVSSHDNIRLAMEGIPNDLFKLMLMHSPDSVGLAAAYNVDLVLSGHTHGGQIKLPIIGPGYTHSHFGNFMSNGLYKGRALRRLLGYTPKRTQLYVTRGIGVSGLAIRFLCRPEITTIVLKSAPYAHHRPYK